MEHHGIIIWMPSWQPSMCVDRPAWMHGQMRSIIIISMALGELIIITIIVPSVCLYCSSWDNING